MDFLSYFYTRRIIGEKFTLHTRQIDLIKIFSGKKDRLIMHINIKMCRTHCEENQILCTTYVRILETK